MVSGTNPPLPITHHIQNLLYLPSNKPPSFFFLKLGFQISNPVKIKAASTEDNMKKTKMKKETTSKYEHMKKEKMKLKAQLGNQKIKMDSPSQGNCYKCPP